MSVYVVSIHYYIKKYKILLALKILMFFIFCKIVVFTTWLFMVHPLFRKWEKKNPCLKSSNENLCVLEHTKFKILLFFCTHFFLIYYFVGVIINNQSSKSKFSLPQIFTTHFCPSSTHKVYNF